ncbi:MAG: hypothetical protein ND895_00575 [Pyrinomonadaceae bacterium]|nr:hypothetical protein [Pyrinomonadaceae bacterium]
MTRIKVWTEPPQMSTGAPMPTIRVDESTLFLAYIVSEPELNEELEEYAVVKFEEVWQHTFGYPNDEALGGHPLYESGLHFYAFNEILESPYLAELGRRNAKRFPGTESDFSRLRHWLVAFHDETLEVIARSVKCVGRKCSASGSEAIAFHVI